MLYLWKNEGREEIVQICLLYSTGRGDTCYNVPGKMGGNRVACSLSRRGGVE